MDVAIVGAGAAGLATAIFTRRLNPRLSVLLLDGAAKPGAKILVSGGSRCNVTNAVVTERDFWGGSRADRAPRAARPSGRRHDRVLPRASVCRCTRRRTASSSPTRTAPATCSTRCSGKRRAWASSCAPAHACSTSCGTASGFALRTSRGDLAAARVVLATGGRSLPKSGSDGARPAIARAARPHDCRRRRRRSRRLLLSKRRPVVHKTLSGVAHDAELTVWIDGAVAERLSGVAAVDALRHQRAGGLDASRHWARAGSRTGACAVTLNFYPAGRSTTSIARCERRPASGRSDRCDRALDAFLPPWPPPCSRCSDRRPPTLAQLTREDRRRLAHALIVAAAGLGTRGYTYAEATAGGVALTEIDPATMESRVCPGLYLVGEILDVDGRIGGFNFQWAWSSAHTAARGLAAA